MKLHEIYEGVQFTNIMSIAQRIVDLKNRQKFREKMTDAEYKWLMLTCENQDDGSQGLCRVFRKKRSIGANPHTWSRQTKWGRTNKPKTQN